MALRQRIERSDGSVRTVPLRATLRYVRSADHSHWHVREFMRYELRTADGVRVVRDRKTGFCLGDRYRVEQALPGRAPTARYSDRCGKGAPRLLKIREGISVGWGDNYLPHLEGQELEITVAAAGTVRARPPRQPDARPPRDRLHRQRLLDGDRDRLAERTSRGRPDRRRRPLPAHGNLPLTPERQSRTLTARATTSARMAREMSDCTVIAIFAHGASGIASVGLKAVAFVNPR